tara:strand:+ start:1017 stop:1421 length:405 start_codon:yes stop_codon:yes gene_type:complete
MKKLLFKDENQIKYLLENGLTEVTYLKTRNNKPFTHKFASYWHPYELRHYFRDYAAYSPISYARLGKKINDMGLITNEYPKPTKAELNTILDAIANNISMNLKLFFDNPKLENKTLKQIYKDRKSLRIAMQDWI